MEQRGCTLTLHCAGTIEESKSEKTKKTEIVYFSIREWCTHTHECMLKELIANAQDKLYLVSWSTVLFELKGNHSQVEKCMMTLSVLS